MPFRFFRPIKLGKGLHLNISKRGLGLSQKIGPVTIGTRRTTVNLPGTGLSYYQNNETGGSSTASSEASEEAASNQAAEVASNRVVLGVIAFSMLATLCICVGFTSFINSDNSSTPTPQPAAVRAIVNLPTSTLPPIWLADVTSTPEILKRTPIPPPTRRPTWSPEPTLPTATAFKLSAPKASGGPTGAVCSCKSDQFNCKSFGSQSAAQACFAYCVNQGKGDIHKLDGNNDGLACK
jgi:hypothetical protein